MNTDKVFVWDKEREGSQNINNSGDNVHFKAITFPPKRHGDSLPLCLGLPPPEP